MLILRRQNQRFETLIQNADPKRPSQGVLFMLPSRRRRFREHALRIVRGYCSSSSERKGVYMTSFKRGYNVILRSCFHQNQRFALTTIVNAHFWAAFMLILRRQNQRFETLIQTPIQNALHGSTVHCFPREEDDFVSMHCALFEAIVELK